jgi:hypothetical protein
MLVGRWCATAGLGSASNGTVDVATSVQSNPFLVLVTERCFIVAITIYHIVGPVTAWCIERGNRKNVHAGGRNSRTRVVVLAAHRAASSCCSSASANTTNNYSAFDFNIIDFVIVSLGADTPTVS